MPGGCCIRKSAEAFAAVVLEGVTGEERSEEYARLLALEVEEGAGSQGMWQTLEAPKAEKPILPKSPQKRMQP